MKQVVTFLALIICMNLSAQRVELNNQDGIYVSYQLTKVSEKDKKDRYVVSIRVENKNDYDVYYAVPLIKNTNGTYDMSVTGGKGFSFLKVRNATGLFGAGEELTGQQTKLTTNDNQVLFTIQKGQIINADREFNVKKGEKPVITNSFSKGLKKLDFFDVALSEGVVNGDWLMNCGSVQITLALTKNPAGELIIEEMVNGRQIIWKKTNANTFLKQNDNYTMLTYNKSSNTFTYTNSDGVVCTWTKK